MTSAQDLRRYREARKRHWKAWQESGYTDKLSWDFFRYACIAIDGLITKAPSLFKPHKFGGYKDGLS